MDVLVITDIPRMSMLFDQLVQEHTGLVVVSEINRGIEEIEQHKPSVVVIQNHLAGLSADILLKHLKSKLGERAVRFALISSTATLDLDLASRFEMVLDPSLQDEQLHKSVQSLFRPLQRTKTYEKPPQAVAAEPLQVSGQKLLLPELPFEKAEPEQPAPQPHLPLTSQSEAAEHGNKEEIPQPTYALPTRTGRSIISDFSNQLDTHADDTDQLADTFSRSGQEHGIRGFSHDPQLISDLEEPRPWFKRTDVMLGVVTVVVVVGVSLLQDRASRTPVEKPKVAQATKLPPAKPVAKAPVMAVAPAAPVATAVPAAPSTPVTQQFVSHGVGRPRTLPGFIPKEGHEPGYAKDHPGWSNYRGQTAEYRVYRAKDSTIKAIQVLDLSGAGIQESFYTSMLKELTGATTMRPISSEIKEGYEIRHGEVAGLKLVQYRDAQGGRMRGVVVTWP